MVNNLLNILDEGSYKKCTYYYNMNDAVNIAMSHFKRDRDRRKQWSVLPIYQKLYELYEDNDVKLPRDIKLWFDDIIKSIMDNPFETRRRCDVGYYIDESMYVDSFVNNFRNIYNEVELGKLVGIIPFMPSLSINLSPDWKGSSLSLEHRFLILQDFMTSFLDEYRPFLFTEYAYVVECGSEGNFPHLHTVLQCNPKTKKQLNTWLSKNSKARINKHFKKSCLKNGIDPVGINYQTCRINSEPILNDKIDYLFEDRKPPGHKNLPVDNDMFGAIFKSKDWNKQLRVLRVSKG